MLGIFELSSAVRDEMRGVSWQAHPACPSFEALRLVRLRHWGFDQRSHEGELVVHASLAEEVVEIFEHIYAASFPIFSAIRIDHFRGSDPDSMAANNSSAFNFRLIDGTSALSQHALGRAIDINPLQNPWLRGGRVDPVAGQAYIDRTQLRPGMIVRPGPVLEAFERAGWRWGGDVVDAPDYHHFSKS